MENIKELFDSATYGEIVEDKVHAASSLAMVKETETPTHTYGLRKRTHEEAAETQLFDIDTTLLLENIDTSNKRVTVKDNTETLINYNQLSPESKKLVLAESVSNRQRLIYDILKDNEKIEAIGKLINAMDEDFSYTLASEVGVFMELWICANMKCPGCKNGKLNKYISSNMPVIDVRCVNPEHDLLTHGPLFYQIKATEKYTNVLGLKYFTRTPIINYPSGYIKVGSKKMGQYSHEIKPTDSLETKYISIGYICVTYKYLTNRRFVNIDLNDSFCLIPNLAFNSRTRSSDYYYKYIQNQMNLSIITFNPDINVVSVISFQDLITKYNYEPQLFKNINLDKKYITIPYYRPSTATRELDYESKYLYYKNKYLQLKNKYRYYYNV